MKTKIQVAFICQFALDDFKRKYAGSTLGILWAFFQPIITLVLYWFVFQLGFRSNPVENFPFILWLMAGLVPWLFVSEAIANATTCFMDYGYLVKNVLFDISILPVAKILSTLLVQIVLILFTVLSFAIGGYAPDLYYLQLPLYLIYMAIYAMGIAYITATLYVFFRDTIQIVSIVLNIVFWITPIVWSFDSMPEAIRKVLPYNPLYYIIAGFRNVFIYKEWHVQSVKMELYYWAFVILLLLIGLNLFNKCKNHFADVL